MEIKYKTKSESRIAYSNYIQKHVDGVRKAFDLFGMELCKFVFEERNEMNKISDPMDLYNKVSLIIPDHDKSKFGGCEFEAYAAKFYTSEEDDIDNIKTAFSKAWEHHKNINKHHPEYWCVGEKDGKKIIVPMSPIYFIEMILDWVSVSMVHESNVLDWWYNNDGGRKEKEKLLSKEDFKLVNKWLDINKARLNFRKS